MKNTLKGKIAVLIIDMQDFFLNKFTDGKRKTLIRNQCKVIDFCAKRKIPLIFLEYKDRGNTVTILQKSLENISCVKTITKDSNGGFTDTDLDETLKNHNVKSVVLMGINASGCVQDTAIGALNRGYEIVTSKDIIASSTMRDSNLNTSRKWYSKNGLFFEGIDELLNYMGKR